MTEQIRELQQALKDDPANRDAFDRLADRYAEAGDWRRLRWHFEKYAEHLDLEEDFTQLVFVLRELSEAETDRKEQSAILVALGDVLFEHVGEHDDGMDAYQRAFKTYPEDTTSLDRARRVYRESGQFKRVLLLYDLERKVKKESSELADVLVHMAQVHGDYLGDHNKALETLEEALEADPDHALAATIAEVYQGGGTVESLVKNRVREAHEAAGHGEESTAASLLVEAARLERAREGGGIRKAAELAEKAREFESNNFAAGEFLMDVYEELEQQDELRELTQSLQESDSQAEPAADDYELEEVDERSAVADSEQAQPADASLDEDSLAADGGQSADIVDQVDSFEGDFEQAREMLEDNPGDLAALELVRQRLRDEGAWDELAEQLEDSVRHLRKKDGELEVMVDLANTYWHQLGDLERAEYYFKRIKLLDGEQADMLAFYEDFYQREGQWRKLFALLSGQQSEASNAEEALELSAQLAQLAEVQMDSAEKAIDVWKNYQREWGTHPEAREQLRRLYEENGKWNALVDFLKERVRQLEEDGDETAAARVVLLERIADIYRDELGLDVMVINTLNSILELEPDHRLAFEELKDKLEEGRRWNELAGMLSERADLELEQENQTQAVALLLEVADIWQESLRNVTQALPYLERVLELQPHDESVRDRLRDIYEQRRDYESLFELMYAEAELYEGHQREDMLEELLELAEDRLRDPERSVRVLAELAKLRPDDTELIDKIEFIHRRRDNHAGLADILEQKADTAEGDERNSLLREAAQLREDEVGDLAGAAKSWEKLLGEDDQDAEALERVTAIYIEAERFDELEAVYQRRQALSALAERLAEAAAGAEAERKQRLHRRLADLAVGKLDDVELAVEHLEEIRALVDDPREVARELDEHYAKLGDLDGRVNSNRVLFEHAEDDEQRFTLLVRLADLESDRGEPGSALEWSLQAAMLRPGDDNVLDQAEQAARDSESVDLFAEHIELLAGEVQDDELRSQMWARLGRVLRDDMGDFAASLDFFERLRQRDPEDLDVLDALEDLYERVEKPEARIEVLREQIDLLSSQGAEHHELVDQLSKIADVQRAHLGETDAARETYNEILDVEPNHVGALRGIRQLQREEGRWDEVVDSLHRELSLLSLDEIDRRVDALMELADTLRLHTGDLNEAIHNYGQVLAEEPEHEEAVAAVEELLGESELAREAALMLEPIFRDTDRPAQLARALEARRGVSDDRFEEAEILDELIPLYEDRLDNTELAFEHACRQFELDPEREEVWIRVEQLGAKIDRWEEIERVFSQHQPEGHDLAPGRVNLLRHLASIREHRLGKKELALQTWQQLYEVEPSDLSVVEALERLNRGLGHQEQLVDALEAKEGLVDNTEERIEVLEEIAQLCDTVLEDSSRTIDAYRRVLVLEADHQGAVEGLVRLYRDREEWHDLDELYVTQADLAVDPDRRRDFLLALGKLRADQLADYAGAADLLSQLVTEDPGDDEALEAVEALDATLGQLGDRPGLRLDLARTLEPVYRSREDLEKLAGALETRVEQTHEPFEKVAIFDELTDLYLERIGDDEAAFSALERAVVVDPDDERRRTQLLEVATRLERLEEAAEALEEAALTADPLAAGAILRQIGAVYEDILQSSADAIDAYERALERDERDEESLQALERLYQNTSNFEGLAQNLRQQVSFGDPSRRTSLLARAGTLYEEVLDRPDDAIDVFIDLLDEEPDSVEAFAALERLYDKLERWVDLADTLRRRADATLEEAARIDVLDRLAGVFADKLHDVHEAIAVHREILGTDPHRVESLDALEQIFREEAQWHELSEILRQKLASPLGDDDEVRDALEIQLAAVLREQLFEVDEALVLYRSVLERSPGHPDAIAALEELSQDENWAAQVTDDLVAHYTDEEAFERLVELYETRKMQVYDPAEKAELVEKIALVRRDGLVDFAGAIDAFAEAWKLEPQRGELLDQLLELVQSQQAHARLAEAYEDVLTAVSDPDLMLDIRLRLAELYREQLDDAVEAETHYREVLNLDEESELAYHALESMLIGQDRWLDFVELLERKFNVFISGDEQEARDILLRIATVQEEELSDAFSAADTYRRVLDFDPTDRTANAALSRIYRGQERWQDLAEHLRRRIGVVNDPDEAVELKQELADLQRTELLEPHAAVELYREILNLEPDYQPAVEALEAIFADGQEGLRGDVAEILEPIYRRESAWEPLVEVLMARVAVCDSEAMAEGFLQECAQIAEEHLGDLERAADILAEIFDKSPAERSVRMQLHRLQTTLGDWTTLVEQYSDVLQNNFDVDDELRVDLLAEQGALYETRLDELADARQCYSEVLLYDVEHEAAVDGLERILARNENWLDLADFYRDRADASQDPQLSREWLERLATLYEEVLSDLDEAIAVYMRLNDLDPDDDAIQRTLARLYGHAHRWHDLADLYRRRIDQTFEPEQAMELRFRLAGLLEGELDMVGDALQIYRDILADAPSHHETLRALEGLRRDLAGREGDFTSHRREIIELLLGHYNEQNHWRRIADLLDEKQQLASDVGGQVDALSEMAALIQRSADDEADKMQALMKLARAYCIDPTSENLRERVHERANQLEAWERIIPILLQGLESSEDPDVQASILTAVADAYAGPLEDMESAITAYQQAVEINGDPKALSKLQQMYGELELWEPLVKVLSRRLEEEYDGEARQGLLKRIAMIYDEILAQPEQALVAYEDLREEDPSEVSVLDALIRLYERTERWADLEEVLRTRAEMSEGEDERVDALRKLARVQDEHLGEPVEAIVTYQSVLEADEEDIDTVRALSRLFQATQRWAELFDNLAIERDFAAGVDELNDIEMRMAIVRMDKQDAPVDAVDHLRSVVQRDPSHLDAREALGELIERPETRQEAASILQRVYREAGEWEKLQDLFEQQLEYVDEPQRRAEIFMELAQLQEEEFDTRQMAFITLGRALRELPQVAFLRHELERLSRALENVDELVAVYEDTIEAASADPDAELELRKRVGQLYAEELDERDAAIDHFEEAARIDEYDRETLDWLDRLYQNANRWEDLSRVLETRMAACEPDQINDVRFRLAYLREVIFEEHRDALDLYRQIIAEEPQHGGAIEGLGRMVDDIEIRREVCELLEPIYETMGVDEELSEMLELKLDVADSAAERAELHKRIAAIQIDALDSIYGGCAHLSRALREDPHDGSVQERLEELADIHELHEQLVTLYEDIVEELDDPVRLVELASRAAAWAFGVLQEPQRATTLYQRVLEVEPENERALDALETIARQEDQPQALETVLARKAEMIFEPDERKEVLVELGQVRLRLELFDDAIVAYREALNIDETDVEVLNQLVGLLEITERYDELVDTLGRLAGLVEDADERRLLYVRIGQYNRHFLDAPERAIEAYRQALDVEPNHHEVLTALEELYKEVEQWHNLLEIVERELALIDEAAAAEDTDQADQLEDAHLDERLRLLVERARVQYEQFGETEQAMADYQRAFELKKDSPVVVEALDGLYRSEGRWEALMELYREQLQFAKDEDRLVELHIAMADISQEHLDADDQAFELLDMVLELRPHHSRALGVLQAMRERRGEWNEVCDVLVKRIESAEGDDKIALITERADVFDERLEQPDQAASALVDVFEVDPAHEPTLERLKSIYESIGAFEQLYALGEHEAALAETEDEKVEVFLRMAEVAKVHLADPQRRTEALERAYALRDEALDIVEPLLDAYIASENFERAEPLLENIIETLRNDRQMQDVVRFQHLRGKLTEQKGDFEAAKAAYEAAHKIDATYIPNLLSLGKLLVRTEEWDDALKIFQTLLLHQMSIDDPSQKVELYYNLGRVRLQKDDARRAKDMFNRALGVDSEHQPSKDALANL